MSKETRLQNGEKISRDWSVSVVIWSSRCQCSQSINQLLVWLVLLISFLPTGPFGFLAYEHDEGKKLFFHTSEVEGGELLAQGDEVEFVVVTNRRSGKHSACCVRKLR